MSLPLTNISLLQIRAFLAVAEHGSFTQAALFLHRTQPAITMQVRQLEETLGLKLIDRSTRRLRVTSAGQELLPAISTLVQQLDAVVESSRDIVEKRGGIVRIACLPSMAANFLPQQIATFRRKYEGVSFQLYDALGDQITQLVTSGQVEFGITDYVGLPDLEVIPLLEDRMCVVFLEGHPLESVKKITLSQLARSDLILMVPGSNARKIIDTAFVAKGYTAAPVCEASYMSTAIGLVQAGLGITLLPRAGVSLAIDSRLRCRDIDIPGFSRSIAIVRPKGRTLSPAAENFLDTIRLSNKCRTNN